MNEVAQRYSEYPIEFWMIYTSESHPEFFVESSWVVETYDARRQRARNFLWTLDYLGIPMQLQMLIDNTHRREVWSQFPSFWSEVRGKYGGGQSAWIIDLNGKLVTTIDEKQPAILDSILADIFAPVDQEGGE